MNKIESIINELKNELPNWNCELKDGEIIFKADTSIGTPIEISLKDDNLTPEKIANKVNEVFKSFDPDQMVVRFAEDYYGKASDIPRDMFIQAKRDANEVKSLLEDLRDTTEDIVYPNSQIR